MKTFFKIIGSFFSVIMCIVAFAFIFTFQVLLWVNFSLSSSNIKQVINNFDSSLLLKDSNGNKTELYYDIMNSLEGSGITEENIINIMNSKGVKNIVGKVLGNASDNILFGKSDVIISDTEIKDLITDNIDTIIADSKIVVSSSDKQMLMDNLDEFIKEFTKEIPTVSDITKDNEELQYFRQAFSLEGKLIIAGVTLFLFLLVALFKWSFKSSLRDNGIVNIIASSFMLILGLMITLLSGMALVNVNEIAAYTNIIKPIVSRFGLVLVIQSAIFLAFGILEVVLAVKVFKKKKEVNTFLES